MAPVAGELTKELVGILKTIYDPLKIVICVGLRYHKSDQGPML